MGRKEEPLSLTPTAAGWLRSGLLPAVTCARAGLLGEAPSCPLAYVRLACVGLLAKVCCWSKDPSKEAAVFETDQKDQTVMSEGFSVEDQTTPPGYVHRPSCSPCVTVIRGTASKNRICSNFGSS